MTSSDSPNAISSPESGGGLTPSTSPDGGTDLFGQPVVRASRSLSLATGKGPRIFATYGRPSFDSFASDGPSKSLASKLSRQFGGDGTIVLPTIWKARRTPSGRWYYMLGGLGRSIAGTAFTGPQVPTPTACDHKGSGRPRKNRGPGNNLRDLVQAELRLSIPAGSIGGLSDGLPNRMGQLRGYGNAIVPQVAAAFIQAYLEASESGVKV